MKTLFTNTTDAKSVNF